MPGRLPGLRLVEGLTGPEIAEFEGALAAFTGDLINHTGRTIEPVAELLASVDEEDLANLVLFLASDESRMITGAVIPAEGGLTAY